MGDRSRGVYKKFIVKRTDGKHRKGQKHEGCYYFVLDCDHDPHAKAALEAYAASCIGDYPLLARDVLGIVSNASFGAHCDDCGKRNEHCMCGVKTVQRI